MDISSNSIISVTITTLWGIKERMLVSMSAPFFNNLLIEDRSKDYYYEGKKLTDRDSPHSINYNSSESILQL